MKHYFGDKKYQNGITFRSEENIQGIMTGYFKGQQYFISGDGLRMLEIKNKNYHMWLWGGYGWEDGGNAGYKLSVALTWLSTGQLIYD